MKSSQLPTKFSSRFRFITGGPLVEALYRSIGCDALKFARASLWVNLQFGIVPRVEIMPFHSHSDGAAASPSGADFSV